MFDNDFERTKEYLKSRLYDYLKEKGINPNTSFRCLNPAHTDIHPSMGFNRNNNTVHCFACNATYNIFDLVGLDYSLSTFKERLDKLSQMYLGINANHVLGRDKLISHNHENQSGVSFGIVNNDIINDTNETLPKQNFYNSSSNDNGFKVVQTDNHVIKSPILNTLTNATPTYIPQSAVFGRNNTFADADNFSPQNSMYSAKEELVEIKNNCSSYFKQCNENIIHCDYFKQRGICDEVIKRFKLGYDEKFVAGIDANSGDQFLWKAAIIPYNDFAYMARNTDPFNKDRIRKRGNIEIFNEQALLTNGPIFITEGEFDALSLESLGYKAVALGGVNNVKLLCDKLSSNTQNLDKRILYISLDNDKAGIEASNNLINACIHMHIAFKQINIAYPYKDINEALVKNKTNLVEKLNNLEQFLNYKLQNQLIAKEQKFISNIGDLIDLNLSPNLYVISGKPILLHILIANIIKECKTQIIYASSYNQWQLVCNNINLQNDNYTNKAAKFIQINSITDLKQDIDFVVNACHIQNQTDFSLIVDLCGYHNQIISDMIAVLGDISIKYSQKILVITQECNTKELEGHALQVINVEQNTSDVIFKTYDKQGQTFEFSMCKY